MNSRAIKRVALGVAAGTVIAAVGVHHHAVAHARLAEATPTYLVVVPAPTPSPSPSPIVTILMDGPSCVVRTSPGASTFLTAGPGQSVARRIGGSITLNYRPTGDTAIVTYTVRSVGRAVKPSIPPKNGAWVVMDVAVTNPGCGMLAGGSDFTFVGSDGVKYQPTLRNDAAEFETVTVGGGYGASGFVYYDVPPAALPGTKITLDANFGPPYGFWRLPAPLPSVAWPAN